MIDSKLTNSEISKAIKSSLKTKGWSIRQCCNEYNRTYIKEIALSKKEKMEKDFVHRVCTKKFSVLSQRVADLCDFLKIDFKNVSPPISKELEGVFYHFEYLIQNNPNIAPKLQSLLRNVVEVVNTSKGLK